MELYTISNISEYTGINRDTLLSRVKTLGIKSFHSKPGKFYFTRSQAGCLIGNYTYSNDNEFLILESKLCNIE
jgi:hypothetical protein